MFSERFSLAIQQIWPIFPWILLDRGIYSLFKFTDSRSYPAEIPTQQFLRTKMANATSTQLQELYVAYFGRAADPTGLDYWTSKGITTAKFAADMYAQNEFKSVYGSLSTESQVNQIYKNLFDRTADAAGLSYWTQEINLGNLKLAEIATHLIWAAQNNSGSEDDKTALTNKTNAAVAYTAEVKSTAAGILAYQALSTDPWSAGDNITEAKSYMSGIDKSTAHTAAGITTSVAVLTGNGVPAEKKTFTLTTSVDTFTGGDGGDTFTADNTGTTATSSTADTLKGGDGTDTVEIFTSGTAATAALPKLTSVEKISIYDMDVAFDASGVTGLTNLDIYRGEGDSTFTVASGVDVSINEVVVGTGTGAVGITAAYSATQTSANLTLDKVTKKGTATDEDVIITGAKVDTVNVTTSGTKSKFDALDVAAATTINLALGVELNTAVETTGSSGVINVTGAGAAKLGAIDTGITTLDASGNSGGLTAQIGAGTELVLTGSSGNDTITTCTTNALATTNKLAVNAGAGTDTLVIADASDVNTAADAARYTGFEKVKLSATQNVKLLSDDVTAVELAAATDASISGLSVTQSANVTVSGNQTNSVTFAGRSTGGSSDVLTLDLKSSTSTTNVTVAGGVFTGYETVNINASTGTDGTDSTTVFATAGDTKAINLTGTADFNATLTSSSSKGVAFTSTSTGDVTVTGAVAKNSTITTGAGKDAVTVSSTLGSTYNTGAGNDTITSTIAAAVATGENDHSIDGGAGTDTLTFSDLGSDNTVTDNHFTGSSNLEKVTFLENSHSVSLTTGGNFTSAFADGVTVTAAALADAKLFTFDGGLYQKDTTITLTHAGLANGAGEDISVTTGAGNDTITLNCDDWVLADGGTTDGGNITVSTRAGDDKVTITAGQLLSAHTSQYANIDLGTGADTLTLDTTRAGDDTFSTAIIAFTDGDSLETSYDKITGFEVGDTTNFSDQLDFGTVSIGTLGTSSDNGVIKSHSVTAGVALFDDAATYAAELIINSGNITDVLGYLESNSDAGETFAFAYDSVGDGSNDATMVWNNGTKNSLVQLSALTGVDAIITTNATGANDLCII